MFIRFSALLLTAAFSALVVASPNTLEARQSSSSECNTGSIQCCTTTEFADNYEFIELLGLLGIILPPSEENSLIGVGCSPLTGAGSSTGAVCDQQPVCCNGNTFVGLVTVGCSPITINS